MANIHSNDENAIIESLPQRLKELGIDAVISGVGACGSCTPAVVRASVAAERAGVPTASLISEGFVHQAKATVVRLGLSDIPIAVIPGHPGTQSHEELRENALGVILDDVISNLTSQPVVRSKEMEIEPSPEEIVFSGSLSDVNEYFYKNEWSDGLPVIPPTNDCVETFLRFTDKRP